MNLYQKISHGRKFYVLGGLFITLFLEIRNFLYFLFQTKGLFISKKSKVTNEKKMTPGRKLTKEPNTALIVKLWSQKKSYPTISNRIQ